MKAHLKFNLPEESVEFNDACNGTRWKNIVNKMADYLALEIRNSENFDQITGLEIAQEQLWEFINQEEVFLD